MLASGFYKNNKQDSMFYTFYENGKPFQKEHFSAGHNFGSQYQYYENGNIKSYTLISTHFFRNNGYQFRIDYDSMQRIKKTTGELIYLQIDNKKDLYLPSDSILLNFIIAKPENYKTVFTVKLDNKLNNHPEELTSAKLDYMLWADLYFCQIPVECHNADMPITYIGILKLYDSLTNKLIIGDSVSYEVKVKK